MLASTARAACLTLRHDVVIEPLHALWSGPANMNCASLSSLLLSCGLVACSGQARPTTLHPNTSSEDAGTRATVTDAALVASAFTPDAAAPARLPALHVLPNEFPGPLACIGFAPSFHGVLLVSGSRDMVSNDSQQVYEYTARLVVAAPGREAETLHTTSRTTLSTDGDEPGDEPARVAADESWRRGVAPIDAVLTTTPPQPCTALIPQNGAYSAQIDGTAVRLFVERNTLKRTIGRARPLTVQRLTVTAHDGGDHESLAAAFTIAGTSWLVYSIANSDTGPRSESVFAIDIAHPPRR
jgi:hypothetical protein